MYFSPPSKSSTCYSRRGTPLTEYNFWGEAKQGANYENSRNFDVYFVPYQCDRCGKFHLKPEEFYVPKLDTRCSCTDTNGYYKDAYPNKSAALKMARIRLMSGIRLSVYSCPEGNGWHLTSHPWR